MAHHNSTPKSVLKAPSVTVLTIHEHTGPSRRERRKFRTSTGRWVHIPKHRQAPTANVPYVKPRPSTEAKKHIPAHDRAAKIADAFKGARAARNRGGGGW